MKYKNEHEKWIKYLKPRYHNNAEVRERHRLAVLKWNKNKMKDKAYAKEFRRKKAIYLKKYMKTYENKKM